MRPVYPFQWRRWLEKLGFWSGETTQAAIDAVSVSSGVTDHGALSGLADDDHSQYHNDTRGDARYYTQSQVDAKVSYYRRLGFLDYASGNHTLTNQPSTEQFLANSSRNVKLIDLSTCTQIRFNVRVVTGSASANSPRLIVKYSTSWTTTLGSYVDIGASEVSASLTNATLATSGWVALAGGAKVDPCYVTVTQIGGDGVADPAFAHVDVEFK